MTLVNCYSYNGFGFCSFLTFNGIFVKREQSVIFENCVSVVVRDLCYSLLLWESFRFNLIEKCALKGRKNNRSVENL